MNTLLIINNFGVSIINNVIIQFRKKKKKDCCILSKRTLENKGISYNFKTIIKI